MNKKAQIKMAENIGVMIIFIVLVVLGIIFYFAFQTGEIEQQVSELQVRDAVQLANRVALFPELQCTKSNVKEDHCLDKNKIKAAEGLFEAKENFYFPLLGYSTITVELIYPEIGDMTPIIIYDKERPNYKNKDNFFVPVSLYDAVENKYSYGILEVSVYN